MLFIMSCRFLVVFCICISFGLIFLIVVCSDFVFCFMLFIVLLILISLIVDFFIEFFLFFVFCMVYMVCWSFLCI